MDLMEDIELCVKRNIHNRTRQEIEKVGGIKPRKSDFTKYQEIVVEYFVIIL